MLHKKFNRNKFNNSRRRFLKNTAITSAASISVLPGQGLTRGLYASSSAPLKNNPLGFNGERQDPLTGCYHLGQGYRQYNPRLMRFHAYDSMSPFGRGGTHGYAYCLGDPVNQRDPSGHFALLSLLIGAIIGA
ncbi:RHS repeat-associated core domain-containing protein, partial [Vibrio sagamiensis]